MPIYLYHCETCNSEVERILPIGTDAPVCHGEGMRKMPTFPGMVKMKGEGGYPSRRKEWKGTAPYTTGFNSTRDPNSEHYGGKMDTALYGQTRKRTMTYPERLHSES